MLTKQALNGAMLSFVRSQRSAVLTVGHGSFFEHEEGPFGDIDLVVVTDGDERLSKHRIFYEGAELDVFRVGRMSVEREISSIADRGDCYLVRAFAFGRYLDGDSSLFEKLRSETRNLLRTGPKTSVLKHYGAGYALKVGALAHDLKVASDQQERNAIALSLFDPLLKLGLIRRRSWNRPAAVVLTDNSTDAAFVTRVVESVMTALQAHTEPLQALAQAEAEHFLSINWE